MTAFLSCECVAQPLVVAPLPEALPLLPCAHARLSIGLDRAYCPDCKGEFTPRTREYKRAIAPYSLTSEVVAPEQLPIIIARSSEGEITGAQFCSGAKAKASQGVDFRGAPKSAPEQKHWVEIYSPSNRKDHKYYRYMWMEGRKILHRHIPGGNTKSPDAIARALGIKSAIASGQSPRQILHLIKSWRTE